MPAKPIVAIKVGDHLIQPWIDRMTPLLPEFDFISWHDNPDQDLVEYVIGWCPDARWINGFPNIKAVVSVGSGVDHIIHLDELKDTIPVIRTVSDDLIQRVREFAALSVLSWHRQFPQIIENNSIREWKRFSMETSSYYKVGVMGYGSMGKAVAETLSSLGYNVSVWANSKRDLPYNYYYGRDSLSKFAKDLDILICLLPLTNETENILNEELMRSMNQGGCVINFARGAHLVDDDLFKVLDDSHLSAAYLDGFREEPLPYNSKFLSHEKVIVTFHSAGYISPDIGPKVIAANIQKFERNETPWPMYNREKGF
ncbi:phosphoglycerate dehydrogenase-like oxidoreductase (plasmid) [Desulfocapsa sulfexigens DSM 10523]|uniref:Phosphoglycerate dehydrogenase-like oxidoreductase n=1 Tax=Desulfocapsa sulfexigens (strain DSM 10523 / SB164P1) TaxID=1167006 RepID=M1PEW9_DESSD|nr:NAD(P)-dependent oxidoreductase [Desulfocapsa sulfexigens]AGF80092.1 phosphoglycerate dehydrogenase-like oxidoreductase [Desulfocapsa sulfexigens DSM 10523]